MLDKQSRCPICAASSPQDRVCGNCLNHKPAFRKTIVGFSYDYPVEHLIKSFKYRNHPEYSIAFADVIFTKLDLNGRPDAIVPTPLHKMRQAQRGYNQSLLLSKCLANKLNIQVNNALCERRLNTAPQSKMSLKERKKNIKGAFKLTSATVPKHIAIVDDVITTGATIAELAKLFKTAGCEKIDIWAIAKTN